MGPQAGLFSNILFVAACIVVILTLLWLLVIYYEQILRWCLSHRWQFMIIPTTTILFGIIIWIGFNKTFGFVASGMETLGWKDFRQTTFWEKHPLSFPV